MTVEPPRLHRDLQEVADDFASASERLRRLASVVPEHRWAVRPAPQRWSIADCVVHLNLTSAVYLPILDEGLEQARQVTGEERAPAPRRYRRDFLGWMLWSTLGPPVRIRTKTTARFEPAPASLPDPAALVSEFDRLQNEQLARLRLADGLPLGAVRVVSPFDARVRYNLFSCFSILPRHQHRHLWQAEQAVSAPASGT